MVEVYAGQLGAIWWGKKTILVRARGTFSKNEVSVVVCCQLDVHYFVVALTEVGLMCLGDASDEYNLVEFRVFSEFIVFPLFFKHFQLRDLCET